MYLVFYARMYSIHTCGTRIHTLLKRNGTSTRVQSHMYYLYYRPSSFLQKKDQIRLFYRDLGICMYHNHDIFIM
jgi:hypothetical protein